MKQLIVQTKPAVRNFVPLRAKHKIYSGIILHSFVYLTYFFKFSKRMYICELH